MRWRLKTCFILWHFPFLHEYSSACLLFHNHLYGCIWVSKAQTKMSSAFKSNCILNGPPQHWASSFHCKLSNNNLKKKKMSLNGPLNMIRLLESNKLEQRQRAAMENSGPKEAATDGWSDRVEDLVDSGDVDGAISLLESIISNLESLGPSSSSSSPCGDLRLATALGDLAHLESSRGFSIKADELRTRALLVRAHAVDPLVSKPRSVFDF